MTEPSAIAQLLAGHGRVNLVLHGSRAAFAELSSAYPLKLLSSRVILDNIALLYMLSYGGGLVSGDCVVLEVSIVVDAILVMLSQVRRIFRVTGHFVQRLIQGSTKVFRTRPGSRQATITSLLQSNINSAITTQQLHFSIEGSLFLLPDPVTCFKAASYHQTQTFRMSGHASLAVLDWITAGRRTLGEDWAFTSYYSCNEVYVGDQRIIRDATLLENGEYISPLFSPRSLAEKMFPYTCYATLILCGPLVQDVASSIISEQNGTTLFKQNLPSGLIWSASRLSQKAVVIRVAGKETEIVKQWFKRRLTSFQVIIGVETFQRCFV